MHALFESINHYYIGGAVAAFAHELIYWRNVVRRRTEIRLGLIIMSILYVAVCGILAGLICSEEQFKSIPFALGVGYLWNDFLIALSGSVVSITKAREFLENKLSGLSAGKDS